MGDRSRAKRDEHDERSESLEVEVDAMALSDDRNPLDHSHKLLPVVAAYARCLVIGRFAPCAYMAPLPFCNNLAYYSRIILLFFECQKFLKTFPNNVRTPNTHVLN